MWGVKYRGVNRLCVSHLNFSMSYTVVFLWYYVFSTMLNMLWYFLKEYSTFHLVLMWYFAILACSNVIVEYLILTLKMVYHHAIFTGKFFLWLWYNCKYHFYVFYEKIASLSCHCAIVIMPPCCFDILLAQVMTVWDWWFWRIAIDLVTAHNQAAQLMLHYPYNISISFSMLTPIKIHFWYGRHPP